VGFGIDLRARSTKGRGLFRKAPDPRDVGERVGRLVRRVVKDGVVRTGWSGDRYIAELRLHPSAPLATLSVEPDAELRLRAETCVLGPGYHADAVARMAPLLDELDFAWTEPFDAATTKRAMCRWPAGQLRSGAGPNGVSRPRTFPDVMPAHHPSGARTAPPAARPGSNHPTAHNAQGAARRHGALQ